MNGSHIAGSGVGALIGVCLAALGTKIGLSLTNADAASLGVAAVGLGLACGHAFGSAWQGAGVFPSIRRGLFGPKPEQTPPADQ